MFFSYEKNSFIAIDIKKKQLSISTRLLKLDVTDGWTVIQFQSATELQLPTTSRRVHVIKYKPRYFHTDNYLRPTNASKWNSCDVS